MQLKDLLRTIEISDMFFTTVYQNKTVNDAEIYVKNIKYVFSKENDEIWSDVLHAEIISIDCGVILFDNVDWSDLNVFIRIFDDKN
jgi:hypothetical protein